jgi:hypothetical protein
MPERERAGHGRTGIAARASSRWTESDRAALELARTRVSAARAASEGSKPPAASDRTAGSSRSSRPPRIFRHTIREAFREWLFERERERAERVSVINIRRAKPPANPNVPHETRNARIPRGIPDVSVATLAKVRAWVKARRAFDAHSTHSTPTPLAKPSRDGKTERAVFVSTNAATAARAATDPTSGAPSSRHADYVVKCAHLAFPGGTGVESSHVEPGYFEEDTGRWVPAFCARRVACQTQNAHSEEEAFLLKRTRHATFVFCPACHDAFLVRELTRCDPRTSACHACGSRVPRSATTKTLGAEGKTTCVFCAFAARRDAEKKKKKKRAPDEPFLFRETDANGFRKTDSVSSSSSPGTKKTTSPACTFLDADDVPRLDALRAAVAGGAPSVFLRWDAVARRARNAETDARWRVSSRESNRGGDARLGAARPRSAMPETKKDAPLNWGFLHAGMPAPFAADDFPARHAREFY